MDLPACVIDNGTGYTKMGFAGNSEPQYIVPSAIAVKESAKVGGNIRNRSIDDLDFSLEMKHCRSQITQQNIQLDMGWLKTGI